MTSASGTEKCVSYAVSVPLGLLNGTYVQLFKRIVGPRNAASYAVTVSYRVTGWYTCSALQANRLKNTDNHMQTIIGEFL